ncbi:MAG: thioredoxin family protein [Phycisphaeraceae bacterium]|nr:thioredoxin family protein [Phycisphaeraceae bacterium]
MNDTPSRRRPRRFSFLIPILAIIALLMGLQWWAGRSAETPPAFRVTTTLAEAASHATESNRPVLVFATASWCGPCQVFKRGALADAGINKWITDHTEPVYLDVDKHPQDAAELGIRSIPALVVLRGDSIVASHSGVMGAPALRSWLEESAAAAPAPAIPTPAG